MEKRSPGHVVTAFFRVPTMKFILWMAREARRLDLHTSINRGILTTISVTCAVAANSTGVRMGKELSLVIEPANGQFQSTFCQVLIRSCICSLLKERAANCNCSGKGWGRGRWPGGSRIQSLNSARLSSTMRLRAAWRGPHCPFRDRRARKASAPSLEPQEVLY